MLLGRKEAVFNKPLQKGWLALIKRFYSTKLEPAELMAKIDHFASIHPHRIKMAELLRTGSQRNLQALVHSAQFLQTELPVRMAHRVKDMQMLPFIVGLNPYVKRVISLLQNKLNNNERHKIPKHSSA